MADAHCHLDLFDDPEGIVDAAVSEGVGLIITAGGSNKSNAAVLRLSKGANVFGVIGIDPGSAGSDEEHVKDLESMLKSNKNIVGIGEIGLDKKVGSELELQKKVFIEQLGIAKALDVPVVIHSRGMMNEVMRILEQEKVQRAMFHFFEGNAEQAQALAKKGFLISIPPVGLDHRRRIINAVDKRNIVAETDCPVAGRDPRDVSRVIEAIAGCRGVAFGEAALTITENVKKFFYI